MSPVKSAQITKKIICGTETIISNGVNQEVLSLEFIPPLEKETLPKIPKEGVFLKPDNSKPSNILSKMHFLRANFGMTDKKESPEYRIKSFNKYAS